MSKEQLKAFMEKVQEDKGLQEKLEALPKDDMEAAMESVVAVAQTTGFDVEISDFIGDGIIADEELAQVAGGGIPLLGSQAEKEAWARSLTPEDLKSLKTQSEVQKKITGVFFALLGGGGK